MGLIGDPQQTGRMNDNNQQMRLMEECRIPWQTSDDIDVRVLPENPQRNNMFDRKYATDQTMNDDNQQKRMIEEYRIPWKTFDDIDVRVLPENPQRNNGSDRWSATDGEDEWWQSADAADGRMSDTLTDFGWFRCKSFAGESTAQQYVWRLMIWM